MPPFPCESNFADRHGPGHFKHHMDQDHLPPFLEGLNLTDKQQTDIKALLKENHSDIETKFEAMKSLKQEMHKLSFSNDFTDEKLKALFDKGTITHNEMVLKKAHLDNSIFHLLNPQQQQQLQAKLATIEDSHAN